MRAFIAICITLLLVSSASAEIYKFVDSRGVIVFTDNIALIPSHLRDKIAKKAPVAMKVSYSPNSSLISDREERRALYQPLIKKYALKYGLDPRFVEALVQAESNFNSLAVSVDGAMGLMQLMPETARRLRLTDPFAPEQNIEGGTRFLRYLVERFGGNLVHAAAAYNAGPLKVEAHKGVPPIKETRNYVKKIFSLYKGKKNMRLADEERSTIQRVVLPDGSVLYTNQGVSVSRTASR